MSGHRLASRFLALSPAFLICAALCGAHGALAQQGAVAPAQQAPLVTIPDAASSIQAGALLAHATFLASDELGGRETASPGQEAAARYIATRLAQWGIEPLGDEEGPGRSWFQSYPLVKKGLDPAKTFVQLGASGSGEKLADGLLFFLKDDEPESIAGRMVFCGLGRQGRSGAENDFAGRDLTDSIAVILMRPRARKGADAMGIGGSPVRDRANAAQKVGAKACVVLLPEPDRTLEVFASMFGMTPKQPILSNPDATGLGAMMDGAGMAKMFAPRIPTAIVAGAGVARVLRHLGLDPEKVLGEAGRETPDAFEKGVEPEGAVSFAVYQEDAEARNVVGFLRGSDPTLAEEAVVFSAHMDHVGVRYDGEVFNGADDNASGTSGLLEIARAFALAKDRPRRSVVFLAVSGEEKGLWGSAHYAEHPTWPLDKIVANVNTDMIGRSGPESGPNEVTVTPSFQHGMFSTIVRDAHRYAQALGIGFENGDKYYARSDHYNFAMKKIPVVFFCNGEHPDYHQVSDTADKLDGAKMEKIARLAFATGWSVADAAQRPKVLGKCADWEGSRKRKPASAEADEPQAGEPAAQKPRARAPASRRSGG